MLEDSGETSSPKRSFRFVLVFAKFSLFVRMLRSFLRSLLDDSDASSSPNRIRFAGFRFGFLSLSSLFAGMSGVSLTANT
jgi:hypothetical protein